MGALMEIWKKPLSKGLPALLTCWGLDPLDWSHTPAVAEHACAYTGGRNWDAIRDRRCDPRVRLAGVTGVRGSGGRPRPGVLPAAHRTQRGASIVAEAARRASAAQGRGERGVSGREQALPRHWCRKCY
eukprot:1176594-Prorocentrum_minimum.AAC.2